MGGKCVRGIRARVWRRKRGVRMRVGCRFMGMDLGLGDFELPGRLIVLPGG